MQVYRVGDILRFALVITLTLLHPTKSVSTQNWTFDSHTAISIGRATDNDVVLYSAVVSRLHVKLNLTENGWQVANISSNGTYVDGEPITKMLVIDNMIIRLATSGPKILINLGVLDLIADHN